MRNLWPQDQLSHYLQRYNLAGPRYTSYPTVPVWQDFPDASAYAKSLGQLQKDENLSLYFHLPFCEKLCHFCGCMQVITSDRSRSAAYVEVLLQELAQVRALIPLKKVPVNQVHFGGGTPNFLQAEELSKLFDGIQENFSLDPAAEIAIEMHPRTSTQAFCDQLATLKFNRISLGVQDFDPRVQKLINRHQSYEQTKEMLDYLRSLGFDSFNFDLIYGLPGQSLNSWQETLDKVVQLKPNRLAVYSYAHVPWIKPVQRSFQDSDLPNPQSKLKLFTQALTTLSQNAYQLIGMDHFALEDDELSQAAKDGSLHRNFMGYSTHAESHQVGLGVSAISYVAGNYFQNHKQLPAYEAAVKAGHLASFRGFLLKQDDKIRRDLITQIMCLGKVDKEAFSQQWQIDFEQYFAQDLPKLKPLKEDGLLLEDKEKLQCSPMGQLFLRNFAMAFDPYLDKIQSQAKNPTFSKTI